jgi:O-methyltransferase involved in polyketide biosynthesis
VKINVDGLSPVEQTAFLTLYARALDSRWPRPILGDALADRAIAKIDYDFSGLGVLSSVICQTALRAKMLDERVNRFIGEHPDAVVVDLGAGLDAGMVRVGPPATVDWYSVDLPDVIAVRDAVLPADEHAHSVPVSLADPRWVDAIPPGRPTMLFADGLFAFLSEAEILALFRRITEHFRMGELAFNDYGRIGWASRMAVRLAAQKMFGDVSALWGYAGFKDAHQPEKWDPGLKVGTAG